MRRLVFWLLGLTAVTILAASLAELGGFVAIQVAGWVIEFSFGFLVFVLILLMGVAVLSIEGLRIMFATPGRWRDQKAMERQQRGLDLLDEGYMALFNGDPDKAYKRGRRAEKLLEDSASATLLIMRGAAEKGDAKALARLAAQLEDSPQFAPMLKNLKIEPAIKASEAAPATTAPVAPVSDEQVLEDKIKASRQTP